MTLHIGFTGTRRGTTPDQWDSIVSLVDNVTDDLRVVEAHHGLCIGADAEFHCIMRPLPGVRIVGHPGPGWPHYALCARITDCDEVLDSMPYAKRNRAIVNASQIMIAAPLEDTPQLRGGTWMTIGMARQALRLGALKALYVVGRDGELLDHGAWT